MSVEELFVFPMASRHADYQMYHLKLEADGEWYELLMPKRSEPWDAPVFVFNDVLKPRRFSSLKAFIADCPILWLALQTKSGYKPTGWQIAGVTRKRK